MVRVSVIFGQYFVKDPYDTTLKIKQRLFSYFFRLFVKKIKKNTSTKKSANSTTINLLIFLGIFSALILKESNKADTLYINLRIP